MSSNLTGGYGSVSDSEPSLPEHDPDSPNSDQFDRNIDVAACGVGIGTQLVRGFG
jgi:hypothetical protein